MQLPNVILIGLRGSGKSTLGSQLAQALHTTFLDLDHLTAKLLQQATAADAIQKLGLPAFRQGELHAIQSSEALQAGVLSLGGGTPTAPGASAFLQSLKAQGAQIIYLRATPATLRVRLESTDHTTRPSLTGAHPLDEIEKLFADRDPLYRSLADHTVEVDEHNEAATLQQLIALTHAS